MMIWGFGLCWERSDFTALRNAKTVRKKRRLQKTYPPGENDPIPVWCGRILSARGESAGEKSSPDPLSAPTFFEKTHVGKNVMVAEPRICTFSKIFKARPVVMGSGCSMYPTRRANPQTRGARCIQGTGAPGTRLVTGGTRGGFHPPTRSPVRVRDA